LINLGGAQSFPRPPMPPPGAIGAGLPRPPMPPGFTAGPPGLPPPRY